MMEAIISSIVGSTVGSFLQVGISKVVEIALIRPEEVDQKLERVERTLSSVRSLIRDTEEAPIAYQEWNTLLQELEDAGHDVEDMMDLKKAGLRNRLSSTEIGDIQAMLKDISEKVGSLRDRNVSKTQTTSLADDHTVLGRETDTKNVISMLDVADQSSSNLIIISILGIVGVGKTTLAQLAYNHVSFEKPFQYHKIWVSIPPMHDAVRLTRLILDEVIRVSKQKEVKHTATLESLQHRLRELLHGKKLLLVLDGLRSFNNEEWDLLMKPFKFTVSKIIVTTANPSVSKQLGRTYRSRQYDLKHLSDKDCWQVLKREALGGADDIADPELESVGMEIAKKCMGLPLAAKIYGRLLGAKVDVEEWKSFLTRRISDIHDIKEPIVSAVRWSYCGVPLCLRQAFAYCSMFPSRYEFDKDKIIKLWMGEGLIIPDQESETLEDIGSKYFDQLLESSFFQDSNSKCLIKESIHEIAQLVFGKKFVKLERTENPRRSTRHLLQASEDIHMMSSRSLNMCTGIRTLLLPGKYTIPVDNVRLDLWDFKKLRTLDLSGTQITELTECIGNWKHLRFLDLSNTHLKLLPGKIVTLCVLQTLRLVDCSKLFCLPANIGHLESLRHLELGGKTLLSSMPCEIGNLKNLQTINEFIVSTGEAQLKELGNMNSIRGSLCIKKLENAQDSGTETGANLSEKRRLDKLELRWSTAGDAVKSENVIGHLMNSPHESLKELVLINYGGSSFPGWITLSLRLTTISIYNCPNCILLPCLGNLPNLKSLEIVEMPMLKEVDKNFLGGNVVQKFQRLEILKFQNMPELKSWVGLDHKDMSLLKDLTISNCPSLHTIPSLRHLQHLEKLDIWNCLALQKDDYFTAEQLLLLQP